MKKFVVGIAMLLCCIMTFSSKYVYASETQEQETERVTTKGDEIYDKVNERSQTVYDKTMDELTRTQDEKGIDEYQRGYWFFLYKVYTIVKMYFIPLCVTSIMIGTFLLVFAKKNKGLQKVGIFFFDMALPVLFIFIVYFMPTIVSRYISL